MWPFARHSLGRRGEQVAARYLRKSGYRILAQGYRCATGEIDIVAGWNGTIVFVEVKTRASSAHGEPWQAVDRDKRVRITRAAVQYLKNRRHTEKIARFDVIAITWPAGWFRTPIIEHYADAFGAEGPWTI